MLALHASLNEMKEGDVLTCQPDYLSRWGGTDFYKALEHYRPANQLPHHEAVFFCESMEDLDVAIGGEFVFEIEPLGEIFRHDMQWGSQISCLMADGPDGANEEEIQKAAQNYWSGVPSDDPLWECMVKEARILSVHLYDEYEEPAEGLRP